MKDQEPCFPCQTFCEMTSTFVIQNVFSIHRDSIQILQVGERDIKYHLSSINYINCLLL